MKNDLHRFCSCKCILFWHKHKDPPVSLWSALIPDIDLSRLVVYYFVPELWFVDVFFNWGLIMTLRSICRLIYINSSSKVISSFVNLGIGYTRTIIDSPGLWIMAIHGSSFWNCSNLHSCRLLLLLCEKVGSEH